MSLQPDTLITSNLRLVRKLGQGGMGSVWVAEHLTLRTLVAVKFVSSELAGHPGSMERFTREATAAAQMKHPHVVQVLDHGMSEQGAPYIAMELLEGEDLSHRLRRAGRLSLRETRHILGQTCKALSRAHSLGLVHRDIKPENIFLVEVDGEQFVKVLDFGIARQVNGGPSATATGTLLGTPHYMSPEQVMSARKVDARADLWSIAVVAYQCVTGRVPFDGATIPAVFVAIANGSFAPPSTLVPGISASVDAWFARALGRNRRGRFATAKELAESFASAIRAPADSLAATRPAVRSPPALREQQDSASSAATYDLRGASRRRAAIAAGVVAALGVVAVGSLAVLRPGSNQAHSSPPAVSSEPRAASSAAASASASSAAVAEWSVDIYQLPSASAQPPAAPGTTRRLPKPPSLEPEEPVSPPATGTRPELGL